MKIYNQLIFSIILLACTPLLSVPAQAFMATQISGYGTVSFQSSTMIDTNAPLICGIPGGGYSWLAFTPSKTGSLMLNTDGSNFDTLLGVFVDDGRNLGYTSLIQVACDDDSGPNGLTSALQVLVSQGVTYYIAITGKYGAQGQMALNYHFYEAPVISSIQNQYVNEDQSTAPISFTVSSSAVPANNLLVLGSSSDQALVADSAIVLAGTGTNRTVTVTPTPYFFGTNTITLTVVDQVGNASSNSFLLHVEKVNHPPVANPASFTRYPGSSISISTAALLRNVSCDSDTTVTVTAVSPVSQYGNATVRLGLNNFVVYSPPPAYNWPDSFTYTVTDGHGAITVGEVNISVSSSSGQTVVY